MFIKEKCCLPLFGMDGTCFSYCFKICKVMCFENSLVFFRVGMNNETALPAEFSDLPLRKFFLQKSQLDEGPLEVFDLDSP